MKKISIFLLLALLSGGCSRETMEKKFAMGMDLLYRGRYEDAETYFLALVRELSDAEDAESVRWRNRALMQAADIENLYLNDPRRAIARLRELLQSRPDEEMAFAAQEKIASIFYDRISNCYETAPEIERLVSTFPERPGMDAWRMRLAQCLFTIEQMEKARAESRLLLEKYPNSPYAIEARLLIASSLFVEKKYFEAAEIYQEIIRENPPPQILARSQFELGLCQEKMDQLEAAEQSYINALSAHPQPQVVKERLLALRKRIQLMPQQSEKKEKPQLPPGPPLDTKKAQAKPVEKPVSLPKVTEEKEAENIPVELSSGEKKSEKTPAGEKLDKETSTAPADGQIVIP